MSRRIGFTALLIAVVAGQGESQITTVRKPVLTPQITAIAPADVPMLIGMNSGHAVQMDDMAGAGAQSLASGFYLGGYTTAPVLGRGPNGVLISLVPGDAPRRQVLLPNPGWQVIDERLGNTVDFTMDPAGTVMYGVSCESGRVFRYDLATKDLQTIGTRGTGLGQLSCPEAIAVDAQGKIYVSDKNRVVRMNDITGNGWISYGTGGSGRGEFSYIRGLAVDRKNRIYVADLLNSKIVRMDDMNGNGWVEYRRVTSPKAIALDQFDRMYLVSPVGDIIQRFDDITGAGEKTFILPKGLGFRGPAFILPFKRVNQGGAIR